MKARKTAASVAVLAALAALATVVPPSADAQKATPAKKAAATASKAPSYSPQAGRDFPTQVFWGDTHVHTSASMDAGAFGNRLGFEASYRFARGEELTASGGFKVKLARPLDFQVIADHSDNMGFFPKLLADDPEFLKHPTGKRWNEMVKKGPQEGMKAAFEIIDSFSKGTLPKELFITPDKPAYKEVWQEMIKAAEKYNEPGRFTAFIGYEWTSQIAPGDNLHRVIIYRDGSARTSQVLPYTTTPPFGSPIPEDLWKYLQSYEDKTGGKVLAIAHNGNLSNGLMFPDSINFNTKQPLTKEYVETRAKWEPLYEATQIKGDGEAHKYLSPTDEFAGYEIWDKGNLNLSVPKKPEMLKNEYARAALQIGLQHEQKLGTNPFKFGMIGSTDTHTSLSAVEEDNFFGKHTGTEPSPERANHPFAVFGKLRIEGWESTSSGYAAVWARENTREALFDAMMRRETYATTGPRMTVRFFGSWDFVAADARTRLPADAGYAKGVPMGGDLKSAPKGKAPSFLVAALKDPQSGNLDRIQIVKGWVDAKGARREKVYDVAWSGSRKPDAKGKLPPVGNTVDVKNATWTNTIGASELITVWRDPAFDPKLRAVYYARVIEIPTPRWTAYDAKRLGAKVPKEAPMTTQERAYTSPIWYTPS